MERLVPKVPSRVYYEGLIPPPPGAHFSRESGIGRQNTVEESTCEWKEFNADDVEKEIRALGGNPDLDKISDLSNEVGALFESIKGEMLSILRTALVKKKRIISFKV